MEKKMSSTAAQAVANMSLQAIDWTSVRVAVFDLDGTLYDMRRIRRRMAGPLLLHILRHPGELMLPRILFEFRRSREELSEQESVDIRRLQYERPAAALGLRPERVRQVVNEWFFKRPLTHLGACRYPGVSSFFARLAAMGKTVAVLSDYPVDEKLAALGLTAEVTVSAMDPEVDRLKPHPAGLQRVLELTGVEPKASLLVGDRDDRDGACARRLGVPYLIKASGSEAGPGTFRDYFELLSELEPA